MHILQKVYHVFKRNYKILLKVPPFAKTCLFKSYEIRDFMYETTIVMPLFTLYISDKNPKNQFKANFIRNPQKLQYIIDSESFVALQCDSNQAVIRSKTIYKCRDSIDQLFKYLIQPGYTCMINLSMINNFIPRNELNRQLFYAFKDFKLIDMDKLRYLYDNNDLKQFDFGKKRTPKNLYDLLFNDFQHNLHEWRQMLRKNGIINSQTMMSKQFGLQLQSLYYLQYAEDKQQLLQDILLMNQFFIDDKDFIKYLQGIEKNQRLVRVAVYRNIRQLDIDDKFKKFILYFAKSYGLDQTRQLIKELKISLKYFVD